jgi:uncharacterized membrane protein YeaQ/YmgE (transglycosylase-associated protein family)
VDWVWNLVVGLVEGLVARMLKPGDAKLGLLWTALLGVGGALLATLAGQQLGWYAPGERAGFIGAVVGAMVLPALHAALKKRPAA